MSTTEVRQEIDANVLSAYLEKNLPGFEGPMELKQFAHGQSNPTYLIVTPKRKYVLRKQPPGTIVSKTAHRVDREYTIIKALQNSEVPVPEALLLCTDESVIGKNFYIMSMCEGRVFKDVMLPELPIGERPKYWFALVECMAKLHDVDFKKVGLESFGKNGGYFERQTKSLSKVSAAQRAVSEEVPEIPMFDEMGVILKTKQPPDTVGITHGDFKMDNCIFHPTEPRVLAVIDWEMSTIGHFGADLANTLSPFFIPAMGEEAAASAGTMRGLLGLENTGLPSSDALLEHYYKCRKTGGVSYPDSYMNYYLGFYWWKTAVILQGIAARSIAGQASSAMAKTVGKATPLMGSLAYSALSQLGGEEGTQSKL